MRKFDTEMSHCLNERQYNTIMYGRKDRYIPCNIDYMKDIRILLIKNLMEILVSREQTYTFYTFAVYAVCANLFPLLDTCLDYERATGNSKKISQHILKKLKEESAILKRARTLNEMSELCHIQDLQAELMDEDNEKGVLFEKMLIGLNLFHHVYYLNDIVPEEMTPIIKKYIKMLYNILEIEEKPTVIPHKNQPQNKEQEIAQKGIFVREGAIVLKNIYFGDILEASRIFEILDDRTPGLNRPIFLEGCCFDSYHWMFHPLNRQSILFKNCHFKCNFTWTEQSEAGDIVFDNCVISGSMEFNPNPGATIYIDDCVFEKDSFLKFESDKQPMDQRVCITNCTFYGGFELSKWDKITLKMENITFYEPFSIKDVTFSKQTKVSNLCFPSVLSPEIEASKKQLHDALFASDLKEMAESLNLLSSSKQKKGKFDDAAYQAALQSGWLKPEFAAYFLEKSTNYLAKKRMDDKKKLTQQSLPFKGDAKDIQYPVDALLAFKAKDWNKLKELRKKYNKNNNKSSEKTV